jgi:hypothetical protein
MPDPIRSHDVSGLTTAELERTRRDLQASLGLARPGSAASVPILAHLSAINAELAGRSAERKLPSPGTPASADVLIRASHPTDPGRPG